MRVGTLFAIQPPPVRPIFRLRPWASVEDEAGMEASHSGRPKDSAASGICQSRSPKDEEWGRLLPVLRVLPVTVSGQHCRMQPRRGANLR